MSKANLLGCIVDSLGATAGNPRVRSDAILIGGQAGIGPAGLGEADERTIPYRRGAAGRQQSQHERGQDPKAQAKKAG